MERLNKYISRCGISSRRGADNLILDGMVRVNGEVVKNPAITVDPENDLVMVEGRIITPCGDKVYYAVYKPVGYVSTVDDPHADMKVVDLVPSSPRVFPVGRLDKDSEGLMILTNDGDLTLKMTHPRYQHEREYEVGASFQCGMGDKEVLSAIEKMSKGVNIDSGRTLPCRLQIKKVEKGRVFYKIILKEGKKRQIRKMAEAVGLSVFRLIRIRMGKLTLKGLKPGESRKIGREQII